MINNLQSLKHLAFSHLAKRSCTNYAQLLGTALQPHQSANFNDRAEKQLIALPFVAIYR